LVIPRLLFFSGFIVGCGGQSVALVGVPSGAPQSVTPTAPTPSSATPPAATTSPPTSVAPAAALQTLTLSSGTLQPPFEATQLHYGADVGPDPVQITATAGAGADVELVHLDEEGRQLARGSSPLTATLDAGDRVEAHVTAGTDTADYTVLSLPDDFPEIVVNGPGDAAPGYYFFSLLSGSASGYLFVVDNAGAVTWFAPNDAFDFKISPDGSPTYIGWADGFDGYGGVILDDDMNAVDLIESVPMADGTSVMTDTHEFFTTPAGNRLLTGNAWAPADTSPWGPSSVEVMHGVIQEFTPTGDVVFEWSTRDHLTFEALPEEMLFGIGPGWDYAHLNAVYLDPDDGNFVVSNRHYSQIIKVARSPTHARGVDYEPGEILWRLGGGDSDFRFVDDERDNGWMGFALQHSGTPLPGDRLMVYDNSLHAGGWATGDSRFVEYQLDFDDMTATRVASYERTGDGSTGACGSVQRLAGGHTVIGWGSLPQESGGAQMTEIDEQGSLLLEIELPNSPLSYRVFKHDRDPSGAWLF